MPITSFKSGTKSRSMLVGNTYYEPGSYYSIATTTLSTSTATITFSSIPDTFTHLQLRVFARTNRTANQEANLLIRFNSDTSTNYTYHDLYGDGTNATASAGGASQTSIIANRLPGADATASIFGAIIVDVLDYTSTNKNKTVRALGGVDRNTAGGLSFSSGLWFKTPEAINRIDLTTIAGTFDFVQYSEFALYGIKGS